MPDTRRTTLLSRLRRPSVLAGAVPLAVLGVLVWLYVVHGQLSPHDPKPWVYLHYFYLAMAQHPFSHDPALHAPPTCWRVLAPLIVHLLPLPAVSGFWILTVASFGGAALAMVWFLRGLEVSLFSATAGAVAFVLLAPATQYYLLDFMLIDPLAFALLALGAGCVVHRRGALLVLTLGLLAATKEIAILGGVFAVARALERRDRALLGWTLGALITCVAVLLLIRRRIASTPYSLVSEARRLAALFSWSDLRWRLGDATAGTWGVLLPVATLQFLHPPRLWRSPAFALLVLLAMAQIIIALDVSRIVIYGFPAIIAAVTLEAEYLGRRFRVALWRVWGPILVLEGYWWLCYANMLPWQSEHRVWDYGQGLAIASSAGILLWRLYSRVTRASPLQPL